MTYPGLDTVNATDDVSALFVYVNEVTGGIAIPTVLFAFFIVLFLGGGFAQMRFRGSARWDFAFTVAGFATFGLAVLMSTRTGLLNPTYLIISLGIAILGVIWIYNTSES